MVTLLDLKLKNGRTCSGELTLLYDRQNRHGFA